MPPGMPPIFPYAPAPLRRPCALPSGPRGLPVRARALRHGWPPGELFAKVTEKLVAVFKVDASRQRLDSTQIFSNMRHLGRIGLFAATIKKFLVNLKRGNREIFDALDTTRFERYLKKSAGVFALVKLSESARTLQGLAGDLIAIGRE